MKYELVIGLEIHCELKTKSKIFCSCPTTFGAQENENVCEVCLGLPGTLPVLNETGWKMPCARAGAQLRDRAFQQTRPKELLLPRSSESISDFPYDLPLCLRGHLDITDDAGADKQVGITRIHIEEDAGNSSTRATRRCSTTTAAGCR
jgi:aspartyl-tRNA(Asn)/glutamyl-tRNA(Gln) amidotransferase subunit B